MSAPNPCWKCGTDEKLLYSVQVPTERIGMAVCKACFKKITGEDPPK